MGRAPGPYFAVAQGFHRHPKARRAGLQGRAFYLAALDHSTTHQTDGHIDGSLVGVIAAEAEVPRSAIRRCLDVGLIEEAEDGYVIHDFAVWQRTSDEITNLRRSRSAAGSEGNRRRWSASPRGTGDRNGIANPIASAMANASQPDRREQREENRDRDTQRIGEPPGTEVPSGSPRVVARAGGELMKSWGPDNPFVDRWVAVSRGCGVTDAAILAGAADVQKSTEQLLADGVHPDQLLVAVEAAARNPRGSPRRLDIELRRLQLGEQLTPSNWIPAMEKS